VQGVKETGRRHKIGQGHGHVASHAMSFVQFELLRPAAAAAVVRAILVFEVVLLLRRDVGPKPLCDGLHPLGHGVG